MAGLRLQHCTVGARTAPGAAVHAPQAAADFRAVRRRSARHGTARGAAPCGPDGRAPLICGGHVLAGDLQGGIGSAPYAAYQAPTQVTVTRAAPRAPEVG